MPTTQVLTEVATQHRTHYRWVVMLMIFVVCAYNLADRTNIGVALPFISQEFHLTNLEAGALAGTFFLGYAISQIPAGFWFGKFGTRGLVTGSILGFSLFTGLIGTASSTLAIKIFRFGLGLTEGPIPVGCTSTVNNWFPRKEKTTATGLYISATMFAPIFVPPLCVWIATNYGWRWIFISFAIPGILLALIWHYVIRNSPAESKHVSDEEAKYIQDNDAVYANDQSLSEDAQKLEQINKLHIHTNRQVFTSWNVWGNCLAYFMMVSVLYGLLTWIPSYLIHERGFSMSTMGMVASCPWIGGFIGCISGGYLADKIRKQKPMMMLTAIATAIMMAILIEIPNNTIAVAIGLFMAGFMINIGWPSFTTFPMTIADRKTYPVAIALINCCGNLGGFVSPIMAGYLLDRFTSYNSVFIYFGSAAIISFLLIMTLREPKV